MVNAADIERQLDRLEAKALLHGRGEVIEREFNELLGKLEEMNEGASEDWLIKRDCELGRAFKPFAS